MFEKFGEFDSVEELNRAAAAQREEGDEEAVKLLARENGLDEEDAEDFLDGLSEELATPIMAALGKLELEEKELQLEGMLIDWKGCVVQMCIEDAKLARAVRRKGKRLENFLGKVLKVAFQTKKQVHRNIVKAAGLNPPIYMGIPGLAEVRGIARKYYMEG